MHGRTSLHRPLLPEGDVGRRAMHEDLIPLVHVDPIEDHVRMELLRGRFQVDQAGHLARPAIGPPHDDADRDGASDHPAVHNDLRGVRVRRIPGEV